MFVFKLIHTSMELYLAFNKANLLRLPAQDMRHLGSGKTSFTFHEIGNYDYRYALLIYL